MRNIAILFTLQALFSMTLTSEVEKSLKLQIQQSYKVFFPILNESHKQETTSKDSSSQIDTDYFIEKSRIPLLQKNSKIVTNTYSHKNLELNFSNILYQRPRSPPMNA